MTVEVRQALNKYDTWIKRLVKLCKSVTMVVSVQYDDWLVQYKGVVADRAVNLSIIYIVPQYTNIQVYNYHDWTGSLQSSVLGVSLLLDIFGDVVKWLYLWLTTY